MRTGYEEETSFFQAGGAGSSTDKTSSLPPLCGSFSISTSKTETSVSVCNLLQYNERNRCEERVCVFSSYELGYGFLFFST